MAVEQHVADTRAPRQQSHYYIPATAQTVHWGYFSRSLTPLIEVDSGDFVTIETLTHHAYDDHARMIQGSRRGERVSLDPGRQEC